MGTAERKNREKKQRREAIIDAAEKVFFKNGFNASTMDDIAEKSELSKGTLYLYFKSKEDLHMAVAMRAVNILNKMTDSIKGSAANAIEKLKILGRTFMDFAGKYPGHLGSILYVESIDFKQLSISRDELKNVIFQETPVRMVLELVNQGLDEKMIRNDIPPQIIANTLWTQFLGLFQFVTIQHDLFDMTEMKKEDLFESSMELIFNGIRP